MSLSLMFPFESTFGFPDLSDSTPIAEIDVENLFFFVMLCRINAPSLACPSFSAALNMLHFMVDEHW